MGAGNSKPSSDIKSAVDYYDSIAVHYILTQNFKDLKALTTKKGCDKLVILTNKVLKKYLNTNDISYLAKRIENGVPKNSMKTEQLTFIKPIVRTKSPKKTITGYHYSDENNNRGYVEGNDIKSVASRTKPLMHDMDEKDADNKGRMCKGIAKFYVKIAHVYAAMMKSVNPIYKYTGKDGKEHEISLLNRNKIPSGVDITLSEVNLCNRRINALTTPQNSDEKIIVGTSCSINRKMETHKFSSDEYSDPTQWGSTSVYSKTLGEEPGIKNLYDLYKDEYKYLTGEWVIGQKGKNKLKKDTKTFYKAFTGKSDREYQKWNPKGEKTFMDIPLVDYHNQPECQKEGEGWRRKYTGDSSEPLFAKYAENLKNMLQNAKKRQEKLLKQLDKIFDWQDKVNLSKSEQKTINSSHLKGQYLSLNKDLTEKKLDKIVIDVRDILIDIYLGCEREYKIGLQLFEAIVTSKTLERDAKRNMDLDSKRKRSLASDQDDTEIKKLIDNEITTTVKEHITDPTVEAMDGGDAKDKKTKFLGIF
jgi:hypothetical protein